MGTKWGKGKRRLCKVCGDSFPVQGKRRTCSESCKEVQRQIVRLRNQAKREASAIRYAEEKAARGSAPGSRFIDKEYIRIIPGHYIVLHGKRAREHPTSFRKNGWTHLHTFNCYETYGERPKCYWCGEQLHWPHDVDGPGKKVHVDHLDEDVYNNDPTNLVPSCVVCNTRPSRRVTPDTLHNPHVAVESIGKVCRIFAPEVAGSIPVRDTEA